jgi:adenine phosphoribosyltransferase
MAVDLEDYLRDVPDFPKPGILFKDITPLLASPQAMGEAITRMATIDWKENLDRVAGIESRGFLFGVPLAMELGVGFTPIRKPGKLPWRTSSVEYSLEYGRDSLEIHRDGTAKGDGVIVVDDLLATGGTMAAACELIEGIGGRVIGCLVLVELAFLGGRERLAGRPCESIIRLD